MIGDQPTPRDPFAGMTSFGRSILMDYEHRGPIRFVGGTKHNKILNIDPWKAELRCVANAFKWEYYELRQWVECEGRGVFVYYEYHVRT